MCFGIYQNKSKLITKSTIFIWAPADITSGPEVRKFFKIRTVWKLDVFLSGCRTFNTLKNRKKYWKIYVLGPYLTRIDNPYSVCKMFKNISPDLVRSGRTCPTNLGVRSCPVRNLICPVWLSPTFGKAKKWTLFQSLFPQIGPAWLKGSKLSPSGSRIAVNTNVVPFF